MCTKGLTRTTTVLGVSLFLALPGVWSAEFGPNADALAEKLVTEYWDPNSDDKLFRSPKGYWQTANVLETLGLYLLWRPDNGLKPRIQEVFNSTFGLYTSEWLTNNEPERGSFDDLLWWGLAYLKADEVCQAGLVNCDAPSRPRAGAEEVTLRASARQIFDYVWEQSWDESYCKGGFFWAQNNLYKNAITNSLGLTLAAKLALAYKRSGDHATASFYQERASKVLKWMESPQGNMLSQDGLLNDGLDVSSPDVPCTNPGGTEWTYNQGVYIGGLGAMWQLTNRTELLTRGRQMIEAVARNLTVTKSHGRQRLRVFSEPCKPEGWPRAVTFLCDHDQRIFKGILARYLGYWVQMEEGRTKRAGRFPSSSLTATLLLQEGATSLEAYGKNLTSTVSYSLLWQGPFLYSDALTDQAAFDLMLMAAMTG